MPHRTRHIYRKEIVQLPERFVLSAIKRNILLSKTTTFLYVYFLKNGILTYSLIFRIHSAFKLSVDMYEDEFVNGGV